jgi:hypothetical protein
MQPATWAIIGFILIEVLLFGGAGYCCWIGQRIIALVFLLPAFMCRIWAVNDGPDGDWAWVVLSLLHWEYKRPGKRPDK